MPCRYMKDVGYDMILYAICITPTPPENAQTPKVKNISSITMQYRRSHYSKNTNIKKEIPVPRL